MSLTPTKSNISVEQFFSRANWRGIKKYEPSSVNNEVMIDADDFIPNLTLNVEEFFTHHNWRGIKKMVSYAPNAGTEHHTPVVTALSLQMKVADFFQGFPWVGSEQPLKATIAPEVIVKENKSNYTPSTNELNINDLSDLF